VVASLDAAGAVPLESNVNSGATILSHDAVSTGKLARKVRTCLSALSVYLA
jgi:hypothetical protein